MPNDLGLPLSGKIRNNCRPEHDISDYKSETARVETLSTVFAEIKESSESVKFIKVKDKGLLKLPRKEER